ncbi:MAG: CoA transferase [Hyphomicrobiales bacterium]|nr:MAG: CoA transferase [Hyphomicrobiales bacterium]
MTTGPLSGVRVTELATIGPPSFAGMMLADLGADVVRVDRVGARSSFPGPARRELLHRGKRAVSLDLKNPLGREAFLAQVGRSDILIEGFAPGTAERLGVGPEDCTAMNPRLVYCRLTGWGQDGPWSRHNGQDINVLAATGVLGAIGEPGRPPQIPLDLVGDFAGGSLYMVVGALAALHEAQRSGRGQVIDAAAVDGTSHLMTFLYSALAIGSWTDQRGVNLIDGAAPFYRTYETSDGGTLAVGALDQHGYARLLAVLELDLPVTEQHRQERWPATTEQFAQQFRARTLDDWMSRCDGSECITPVVGMTAAGEHPHLAARQTLVVRDEVLQPAPAPRFSRSAAELDSCPPEPGAHTAEVLSELGFSPATLVKASAAATNDTTIDAN